MAEKVSKGISSTARSCGSKRSAAGAVKVVHISNPTKMVKTSASEFRAVVQSLTGRKRSTSSRIQREEMHLHCDNQYIPQPESPKMFVDELQCLNYMKLSESAIIDYNSTVSSCGNAVCMSLTCSARVKKLL